MTGEDSFLLLDEEEPVGPDRTQSPRFARQSALVPVSETLDIHFPRLPSNDSEVRQLLRSYSPISPRALIWTDPIPVRNDGAFVTVVRRDWLDGFVDNLERETNTLLRARTADGERLFRYISPASHRARSITVFFWLTGFAILFAAMIFTWRPDDVAQPTPAISTSVAGGVTGFSQQGMLAAIKDVPLENLPAGLIAGMSSKPDNSIAIALNTQDPDALRDLLAQEALLPGFSEAGQMRNSDGNYVVTYDRDASKKLSPSVRVVENAVILQAAESGEAIAKARADLIAITTEHNVQLALFAPARDDTTMLAFEIDLSGTQSDVLAAIDSIESRSPPKRIMDWRLIPKQNGDPSQLRLTGTLTVPWDQTP